MVDWFGWKKNLDDTLIGAVLTAPAYVSGLTENEYQFVKKQLELRAPSEIIQARIFVNRARMASGDR